MKIRLLIPLLLCAASAFGQGLRYQGVQVVNGSGQPLQVTIRVCTEPAVGTPCSPLANIYSDKTLSQPLTQPFNSDLLGNWFFYAAQACNPNAGYHAQISGSGIATFDIPDIMVCVGGGGSGGTVTSVSVGELAPLFNTTTNNPNSTPTTVFSLSTAGAHKWLGNNTGASALPAYESFGVADLPFTYAGNTTELATVTGSVTGGHCSQWDNSGNLIDSGLPCSSGGSNVANGTAQAQIPAWDTGTSLYLPQNKPIKYLVDMAGVDCSGVSDSYAALSVLATADTFTQTTLSGRGCSAVCVSQQLLIHGQEFFELDLGDWGQGGVGPTYPFGGTTIAACPGATFTGPVIRVDRSGYSNIHGGRIVAKFGDTNPPAATGSIEYTNSGSGGYTSTHNNLSNTLLSYGYSGSAIPNYRAYQIVGGPNQEEFRLENVVMNCGQGSGTIGFYSNDPNADSTNWDGGGLIGCFQAVNLSGAVLRMRNLNSTFNGGASIFGSGVGAALIVLANGSVVMEDDLWDNNGNFVLCTSGCSVTAIRTAAIPVDPDTTVYPIEVGQAAASIYLDYVTLAGGTNPTVKNNTMAGSSTGGMAAQTTLVDKGVGLTDASGHVAALTNQRWLGGEYHQQADDAGFGVGQTAGQSYSLTLIPPSPLSLSADWASPMFGVQMETGTTGSAQAHGFWWGGTSRNNTGSSATATWTLGYLTGKNSGITGTAYTSLPGPLMGGVSTAAGAAPSAVQAYCPGSCGSTTYTYKVVARYASGTSAASTVATVTNANATLSGGLDGFGNRIAPFGTCVAIAWSDPGAAGAGWGYDLYRITSGGTPSSTGKIATILAPQAQLAWASTNGSGDQYVGYDCGQTGDSTSPPSTSTAVGSVAIPAGAAFIASEGAAPPGAVGQDLLYGKASVHRLMMNNNNASEVQVVGSGADINTSDQVTALHLASPLPPTQGGTGVNNSSPAVGSYLKGNGTNFFTSTGPASGIGTISCANQFPTSLTLNSDAAPSGFACTTVTSAYVDSTIGKTNTTNTWASLQTYSAGIKLGSGPSVTSVSGTAAVVASAGFSTPATTKCVEVDASGNLQIAASNGPCGSSSGLSTTLTSAHLFVGNNSNVATDTALSGDVAITNAGASTVNNVNGVAYPASPSTNKVPVVTASNTVTYEVVPVAAGGTGIASGTSGGILYFSASGTIASSGVLTANALVKGAGAGLAPAPSSVIDNGSTVTTAEQIIGTGGVTAGTDATHAGIASLVGNTTLLSLPSNSFSLIAPNSAAFTAYALQFPSTGPSANNVLLLGALSSGVAQATYGAVNLSSMVTGQLPIAAVGSAGLSGSSPMAISSAGAISITGAAGEVLAGSGPAFTATPTLGVAGSTVGTLAFANATSGSITLSPVTGALGSVTISLPAATGTVALSATAPITESAAGAVGCATCVTSAAALTSNALVIGGGLQASSTISADTTSTHALFATAGAPAFRALAAGDIPSGLRARAIGTSWGDTGGSALSSGSVVYLTVPYACTISAWNMTVDAGTATIDIWKIASGTAIPTVSNTITASALPAISTGTAIHSTTLTGWTTSVSANDIFGFSLKTVATAKYVDIDVECDQ